MNIVDIIIIVSLGLFTIFGVLSGMIKMIFKLLGLIATFFLAKQFSFITVNILREFTNLEVSISEFLDSRAEWILEILKSGTDGIIEKILTGMQLPTGMETAIENSMTGNLTEYDYSILVETVTNFVMNSLGFLLTFLVIYLVLFVAFFVINLIVKLPLLNTANRFGGGVLGLAEGVILTFIIFALLSPFIGVMPESDFSISIRESMSSTVFYDNNIILNYLSNTGFFEN